MRYGDIKPVKLYYTISEVVDLTGIPAHILRYWEQEFTMLRPRKNRAGNRTYKEKDIALIRRIQQLVQVEGFTLSGACKKIQDTPELDVVLVDERNTAHDELEPEETVIPDDSEFTRPAAERKTAILSELQQIRDLLRSV